MAKAHEDPWWMEGAPTQPDCQQWHLQHIQLLPSLHCRRIHGKDILHKETKNYMAFVGLRSKLGFMDTGNDNNDDVQQSKSYILKIFWLIQLCKESSTSFLILLRFVTLGLKIDS